MEKQLLFEAFLLGDVVFIDDAHTIAESLKKHAGRLEVTLPVGIVDTATGNKRIYRKTDVQKALSFLMGEMKDGAIHGAHGTHPKTFFVDPDNISHLVVEAWVGNDNFIYNKWIILNTQKGKDLGELFLAGAKIGVSIRGRGLEVKEADNTYVTEYEYGGTDTVGYPSTGIRVGLSVPKVEVRLVENTAYNALNVVYENLQKSKDQEVVSMDMDKLNTVIENLISQSSDKDVKVSELLDEVRSVKETLTKEFAEKILSLEQAVNTRTAQLSATKERIAKMEKVIAGANKMSTLKVNALQEYSKLTSSIIEKMREHIYLLEEIVDNLANKTILASNVAEALKGKTLLVSDVVEDFRTIILKSKGIKESYIRKISVLRKSLDETTSKLEKAVESMKPVNYADKAVHNSVGVYLRRYPALKDMAEELYQAKTVNELRNRVLKYLKVKGFNATEDVVVNQSVTTESMQNLSKIRGWK